MAIVPFQPNSNWNWKDAKYKFVSMVMIGLLGTFFALLFIYPILSINLVTDAGTQLGAYARQVVNVSCGGTMEAVNMVGSVVNGLGGGMVTTITELTAQTVMAVELIGDVIQSMSDLVSPITSLLNGGVNDVLSAVSLAVGFISNSVGKTMKLASDSVGGVITNVLPLLGSIQEAMSFIITNGFTPAVKTLNGIRSMLADKIEAFTKSELPRVIDAFKILQSVSQTQLFGNGTIAIITLTVALYVKSFKRMTGSLIDSSIVSDLVSSTVSAIGSITADLSGLSFDFCEVLVGLIEPVFSLLNIPGTGDLNNCSTEFIRVGLWYMTNGKICRTDPRVEVVTNFTDCLFGEIAHITLIPAYNINIGASTLFNFIGPDFPDIWPGQLLNALISGFNSLLSGLPSINFGWYDITLNTVFENLAAVLIDLFFKGYKKIFSSLVVSLLPTSPSQALLPLILLYTIYKIVEKLLTVVLNKLNDTISSGLNVINQWNVCTPEIGVYLPSFCGSPIPLPCVEFYGASWCVSDIIGGFSTIASAAMSYAITPITSSLFNITALINAILGSIPSAPASGAFLSDIDQKILEALNNLQILSTLPFYVNT